MARWRRVIQESDAKLRQYRATLDAGADPAVVTGWIAHTQAERNQAEQQMGNATSGGRPPSHLTDTEIRQLVTTLGVSFPRFSGHLG
jgi:site-specific DNA recombinase